MSSLFQDLSMTKKVCDSPDGIASQIGYRTPNGGISDIKFHEEMMAGVDDTPLRLMSAYRCMALGMTQEEVEDVFKLKLPPCAPSI
jgi:hypothetical protein